MVGLRWRATVCGGLPSLSLGHLSSLRVAELSDLLCVCV